MIITKAELSAELYDKVSTKTCCTKAFLCGLLFSSVPSEDGKYCAMFYDGHDAERAKELINSKFSGAKDAQVFPRARGGHKAFALVYYSKSVAAFLDAVDEKGADISHAVGMRCASCEQSFACGVMIASAKISYPKIGYNFEITAANEARVNALRGFLSERVAMAGKTCKNNKFGLYFKSSQSIFDLFQYAGASECAYKLYDTMIERDIRNHANRSTNFTTSNIKRAVDSNRRVIDAIHTIKQRGMTHLLSEELEYTAELRVEYDSASLAELAQLHVPPLSKSGLNARLKKILEIAKM